MIVRSIIRWGFTLVGIGVGIALAAGILSGMRVSADGFVWTTLTFWIVNLVANIITLRKLVRAISATIAGIVALGTTIVSLFIVSVLIPGVSVHGFTTYLWAGLIIWLCTVAADVMTRRVLRQRRKGHN